MSSRLVVCRGLLEQREAERFGTVSETPGLERPSSLELMRSFVLLLALAAVASAQNSILDEIVLERYIDGLSTLTSIKHAGDGSGRLFIVEQRGTIQIVRNGEVGQVHQGQPAA